MVYIQADGSLAAGMLYLRGGPEHRDDHWMMVDKGTGLPVWIDSTLRSARGSLGTAEALGQAFRRGLRLELMGFVWDLSGKEPASRAAEGK